MIVGEWGCVISKRDRALGPKVLGTWFERLDRCGLIRGLPIQSARHERGESCVERAKKRGVREYGVEKAPS